MTGRRLDASVDVSTWAFTDQNVVVRCPDGKFEVRYWDYGIDVPEPRCVSVYSPGGGDFVTEDEAYAWMCGYEWGSKENM